MSTPTVRLRQLGNELRHARLAAGMDQAQAAEILACAVNKISRIELGQSSLSKGDLLLLLREYGDSQEHIDWLIQLARTRRARGAWSGYRAVIPEWFRMYVDLESDASDLKQVGSELVPGILQTEGYIRALVTTSPRASHEDVDAHVKTRQERQAIFTRDQPPTASFILSESCIRRRIGGDAVMREQLAYLQDMALMDKVSIQLMSFDVETHGGDMSFPFTMLTIPPPEQSEAEDLRFVYVESFDDARYLDSKEAVSSHAGLWERMSAAALGPKESLDRLKEAVKRYE